MRVDFPRLAPTMMDPMPDPDEQESETPEVLDADEMVVEEDEALGFVETTPKKKKTKKAPWEK